MIAREGLDVKTAEGMTNQDVGLGQAPGPQSREEIGSNRRGKHGSFRVVKGRTFSDPRPVVGDDGETGRKRAGCHVGRFYLSRAPAWTKAGRTFSTAYTKSL